MLHVCGVRGLGVSLAAASRAAAGMQACLEAHAVGAAALALPQLAAALRRLAGDSVLGPDEQAALLAAPLAAAFFPRWAGGAT